MGYAEETMNPIDQIATLLDQMKSQGRLAPVCLGTVGAGGFPYSRFVDLKEVSEGRLWFGTDERSAKAQEFLANPEVSLCAWWETIPVQVRVVGRVERATAALSDRVFASRNPTAQAVASVSVQSAVLTDPPALKTRIAAFLANQTGQIARPRTWWVFGVVPQEIEILRFSDDRVHRRTHHRLESDKWLPRELSP